MGLLINGITGKYDLPIVLDKRFKYAAFEPTLKMRVKPKDGAEVIKDIAVQTKINAAWRFITRRAAAQKPCNDYFKTLLRKKTLEEVLNEGDITLHYLTPKEGHTFDELPSGYSAGRDIAIDPSLLLEEDDVLACTLIHELAHVAGATTNKSDKNAGAAEAALKFCLCGDQYNPENKG
jgi:hypothetical protein